ncbi:LamG-like jellyroll fold domain-containing protein [Luteolibacter sp. LG18]|uniref:LamG-like jellyroll fold domain-containing protein n=1 Tax=Luteolibacter sp. LG18 TaxID=2819286 RepID=UPI0030C66272
MTRTIASRGRMAVAPLAALVFACFAPAAQAQNFTLNSGVRSSVIVPQGGSGSYTINVAPTGGFTGSVTFTASGLPTGVTASFSPASSTTTTTLTLTANATATTGTKDITVTGTSGSLVKTVPVAVMVTAADTAAPFTWSSYNPDLNYDFRTSYPSLPTPTALLNDTANIVDTRTSGFWSFRYGPNKNALVTSAAWVPMLNRLNSDFAYFRDNMGWPADLRARSGYFSGVYLFGSGLGTDTASNTDLGGWQSATNYQGTNWPMILMSYYPVYSFDPNCPYSDRVAQQGATVHEGIHAVLADAPGCKNAAWIQESGNTWLQGEMTAQLTGNYSGMGWLSATSMLAPFLPIENYSGWLQDGSFGGPSAEGVDQGTGYGSTWRQLFGGVQYSEAFPHFMGEIVSPGSVAWIWQNAVGRVLEGIATANGGLGQAQTRRLIMEYRARAAICDLGKWSGAYQKLLNDNWNASLGPEYTPYWIACDPWTATCYQPTTNNAGVLTPVSRTLPGWSGANFVPLTVSGTGTVSVDFQPLGNSMAITANSGTSSTPEATTATSNNMTCQLVYRAADGSAVYSQPVSSGTCSLRLDKAVRNNVVIAVICSTDYVYNGESSRKTKFDYRLTLGSGVTGTANVNTKWYQTVTQPGLKAIAGNGENHVFWSGVTGATSYTLKRATAPGGPYTDVVTQAGLNYTDTGRTNGTPYYYIATAASATQTSVPSNEVTGTPVAPAVTLGNFGFETPVVASGAVSHNPTGASWTFSGMSGVSGLNSAYVIGNRAAPQGTQVAYLQNTGSISQSITGFTPGSFYTVKFLASQRQSLYQLGSTFDLRIDGRTIKSFYPSQQGSTYGEFTATFTATAASHVLSFAGTNANGGTSMVMLDRVIIAPASSAAAPAAPINLSAGVTPTTVKLTWDDTPLTASYTVKRSTTSGSGYATIVSNVTAASYTDSTVTTGTVYYYVVTATNSQGTSANSNQAVAQPSADLLVHLKFDETSGATAADASGNGRNGTLSNATWAAGKTNNAVVLNGTNGYVTLPTGCVKALNDTTISTWVKLNSVSTWSRIFDFGSGTGTYMFLTTQYDAAKPRRPRFGIKVPGLYEQAMDSAVAIPTGTWTHVAVTISGPVANLYINGALAATCPAMPLRPSSMGSTTANYIGKSQFSDPYLNGSVDDFRIYNRALSQSEVAVLAGTTFTPSHAVAWWNFEQGTADTYVPYSPSSSNQFDGSIKDQSGNGNHLSAYAASWDWYRAQVATATTPQNGAANTLSIQNANATNALSAINTPLTTWSPQAWTIEAAIRPDDATNGYQTFIGRDSQGAYAGNTAWSALYFSVRPAGNLMIQFTDAAGNNWKLESAANVVTDAKWHAVAATSDGSTLSLYLKNITNGDPAYTLLGTLDISSSVNPAISVGSGDGATWDAGVFSVGRGLYAGSYTDRFNGYLDDIRFSDVALAPDQLLYSTPPPVPSGVSSSAVSTSQINVAWTATPGATSYNVKRATSGAGPFTTVASGLSSPAYNDAAATGSGTTYYYTVSALNAMGESAASAQTSASPLTASQDWRRTQFGTTADAGNAASLANPDGDALPNIVEYFHGTNPNATTASQLQAQRSGSRYVMKFPRSTAAGDLIVTAQGADTPAGPWADLARSTNGAAFSVVTAGATATETGTGGSRNVEVRDLYDVSDLAHPKRFFRLKLQAN